MKSVIFNTEAVRATLDNRKNCFRLPVKKKYSNTDFVLWTNKYGTRLVERQNNAPPDTSYVDENGVTHTCHHLVAIEECQMPYRRGDILGIRETWTMANDLFDEFAQPLYRANLSDAEIAEATRKGVRWHSASTMPISKARLFIVVTDIYPEPLQDISEESAQKEGIYCCSKFPNEGYWTHKAYPKDGECWSTARECFLWRYWKESLPKTKQEQYAWDKNPWVWKITYEVVPKENIAIPTGE